MDATRWSSSTTVGLWFGRPGNIWDASPSKLAHHLFTTHKTEVHQRSSSKSFTLIIKNVPSCLELFHLIHSRGPSQLTCPTFLRWTDVTSTHSSYPGTKISDFLLHGLAAAHNQTRHAELLMPTPLNTPLYSSFPSLPISAVTWSIIQHQADVILLCSCSLRCFFLKLSSDWRFLSSWSFYFCWMNQHLHSLVCLTDVYLKIIDIETHSWHEPASAKSGRAAEYIRHISGLLWSYCLRGWTRKGLRCRGRLGLWDPLTGRVVGPSPWVFSVLFSVFSKPACHSGLYVTMDRVLN